MYARARACSISLFPQRMEWTQRGTENDEHSDSDSNNNEDDHSGGSSSSSNNNNGRTDIACYPVNARTFDFSVTKTIIIR